MKIVINSNDTPAEIFKKQANAMALEEWAKQPAIEIPKVTQVKVVKGKVGWYNFILQLRP